MSTPDRHRTTWKTAAGDFIDRRRWLTTPHDSGNTAPIVLDLNLFTPHDHYPDGFLPSGIVLGKVTATGLYGPADDDAADGRETTAGFLFTALPTTSDHLPGSLWLGGGYVRARVNNTFLPIQNGPGSATINARWHLTTLDFDN